MDLPSRTFPHPGLSTPQTIALVAVVLVLGAVAIAVIQWAGSGSLVTRANEQAEFLDATLKEYGKGHGDEFPRVADQSGLVMYRAISGDGVGPDGLAGTEDDSVPDGLPDEGAKVFGESLAPGRDSLGLLDPTGAGTVPSRLVDPWGRSWRYRSGSLENENPTFDFWSAGPDGIDGNSDDIRNW